MQNMRPHLTPQEFQALVSAGAEAATPASQLWYLIRTGFCVAIVTANVLSLSLFFEEVFGKFDLPPQIQSMLSVYVGVRIAFAIALVPVYTFSFYRRVWFAQLSFALICVMAMNLLNDFLLIYSNLRPEAMTSVAVMVSLRVTVMVLLFMNARFYQRNYA